MGSMTSHRTDGETGDFPAIGAHDEPPPNPVETQFSRPLVPHLQNGDDNTGSFTGAVESTGNQGVKCSAWHTGGGFKGLRSTAVNAHII